MSIDQKRTLKNFYYVISSNLVSLIVSILVVIVVPKLIGVREYGYWQLFTFYASYFGVLSLGWWDGIYLEYGGHKLDELGVKNLESLKIQFVQICVIGIIVSLIVFLRGQFFKVFEERVIFSFLAVNLPIYVIQNFLRSIFQATNGLKKYATSVIVSNIIYVMGIVVSILFNDMNYKWILISYTIGNLLSAILLIKDSHVIFSNRIVDCLRYLDFRDSWQNIRIGFSVLVANLAGMLIVGVIRMGIKSGWSVNTFGKISLTLSISNFAMIFIGAIGLVAYPVLRNISKEKITDNYQKIYSVLMLALFVMILMYFPLRIALPLWLPKYQESVKYMAVLFPVLVYQGKFELLTNTLYKVFRYEKKLFIVNAITVLFSVFFTILFVGVMHDLNLTILSLIIVFQLRSALGELFLNVSSLGMIIKNMLIETSIISVFIVSSWYCSIVVSIALYGLVILLFSLVSYKNIVAGVHLFSSKPND